MFYPEHFTGKMALPRRWLRHCPGEGLRKIP
jgi:hypothetical protein